MSIETKQFGGALLEVKQDDRNGIPVGIIKGYIATWDIDRGDYWYKDQFVKGAFKKSISDHKKNDNRQIRLKDHHGRTVGGFPIESVKEDDVGLYGEGEINLDVQQGKELYSLAKQGVITEFSIGFSIVVSEKNEDKKIRTIKEAIVWEGSAVDEPMNPNAKITEVKSVNTLLEIIELDFNHDEAKARIEDHDKKESAYIGKFLIADVVDSEIKAVQDALFSSADMVKQLPENEQKQYIVEFEKYYAKMGIESPFNVKSVIDAETARNMKPREVERVLKETGMFSGKAAKIIASSIKQEPESQKEDFSNLLNELKSLNKAIS
ncbi:MAG: HK97 family phage prohead protease [Gammaproteobacteria bacterium]|nr:HK97 family phage prohead protease [Gammaproteobacteria bacterium]